MLTNLSLILDFCDGSIVSFTLDMAGDRVLTTSIDGKARLKLLIACLGKMRMDMFWL